MTHHAQLMIAASEHDADMLYASGMFVPDPFIVIGIDGIWHGLFSPLEIDRARKTSKLHHVHLDTPWREKAKNMGWGTDLDAIAAAFLDAQHIQHVTVPGNFALIYATQLNEWGVHVEPCTNALFPDRAIKKDYEIKSLARAERLTRQSMCAAEQFLAATSIGDDGILRHPDTGTRVKSAHLRSVIEGFLITRGAIPSHTIVACGREGADPHQIGKGYLRAHQPIIVDIFPRLIDCGYWGDMTRSYVKGKASPEILKLYQTVQTGQKIGLSMVRAGQRGADIHQTISQYFQDSGFSTGMVRGKQTGFFHGTGHGVGLDIHEAPRLSSASDDILQEGHVVTVEPGLYYPRLGGVRLEDMVVVRQNTCENLTRHPCRMEIS